MTLAHCWMQVSPSKSTARDCRSRCVRAGNSPTKKSGKTALPPPTPCTQRKLPIIHRSSHHPRVSSKTPACSWCKTRRRNLTRPGAKQAAVHDVPLEKFISMKSAPWTQSFDIVGACSDRPRSEAKASPAPLSLGGCNAKCSRRLARPRSLHRAAACSASPPTPTASKKTWSLPRRRIVAHTLLKLRSSAVTEASLLSAMAPGNRRSRRPPRPSAYCRESAEQRAAAESNHPRLEALSTT